MNNSKILIGSVIVFFLISVFSLSYLGKIQANENYQKNWWSLYFSEPKSASLNFVIENHSDKNSFQWKVLVNKEEKSKGDVEIKKGEIKNIEISLTDSINNKIIIIVSDGTDKKEIYKNF